MDRTDEEDRTQRPGPRRRAAALDEQARRLLGRKKLAGQVHRKDLPPVLDLHGEQRRVPLNTGIRSEEHTSELQPLMRTSYAVSCLNKIKRVEQTTKLQQIIHT